MKTSAAYIMAALIANSLITHPTGGLPDCDTVAIPDFARDEDYGLVFSGYVQVPNDGLYDFSISSDDGSRLVVGDSSTADNDGIHGDAEVSCSIALKAGIHPIKAYMFHAKGGQSLDLLFQGPGVEKQRVSKEMLFHRQR